MGAPKSPNNATSTFFNTVHLLPKDLRFEHGGAKLASWPGRHLTTLRPWPWLKWTTTTLRPWPFRAARQTLHLLSSIRIRAIWYATVWIAAQKRKEKKGRSKSPRFYRSGQCRHFWCSNLMFWEKFLKSDVLREIYWAVVFVFHIFSPFRM